VLEEDAVAAEQFPGQPTVSGPSRCRRPGQAGLLVGHGAGVLKLGQAVTMHSEAVTLPRHADELVLTSWKPPMVPADCSRLVA